MTDDPGGTGLEGPEELRTLGAGAVVVGMDQSSGARVALAAALREAAARGLRLLVVTAYASPDRWGPEGGLVDLELIERELRRRAEETVAEATAEATAQGIAAPEAQVAVAPGSPVDVLCRAAEGAEMLVVGHRGRGALATRLIGSVGLGVVLHAPCAVLVVRERHEDAVRA